MTSTQVLKNEHRIIEIVLDCLDRMADRAVQEQQLPRQAALDVIRFLREFADGCHHKKEEDRLFPMLESRGFSPDMGPTVVMRHEHVQGRRHIQAMVQAIDDAASGDDAALAQFVQHARAYSELLRAHIQKEDHCLFPMADVMLTSSDQKLLEAGFDEVEHEGTRPGLHEELVHLAEDLARQFGVPLTRERVAQLHLPCCGGH